MKEYQPPIAVIMAAGKSTRMKSSTPKVLHKVAGRAVIDYIVEAAREGCGVKDTIAIVGHEADRVQEHLMRRFGNRIRFALQMPQHGTGHAVMQAEPLLDGFEGEVLTLAGDTPLVTDQVLKALVDHHHKNNATATVLTAVIEEPGAYGRVVRNPDGSVAYIVEAKDASPAEIAIHEINTSIYCFQARALFEALRHIRPENAQGEYYLTDVIALLARQGERVEAVISPDPAVVMGVNTRVELAEAALEIRQRILTSLMLDGVTVIDPQSTYVDVGVTIGQDTTLYPGTVIEGATTIGSGCVIGPHAHIVDSIVADNVSVNMSRLLETTVGQGTSVGPFANLRAGTITGESVRVGSFVELKKADLGDHAHVAHLTYIGDASIGARANIGGGTITCNFDGHRKNRTTVEDDAFVGSNNTLVAPVTVGRGAYTAAGSTITKDVPPDALGIGRGRQSVKEGWAAHRREQQHVTPPEETEGGHA